MWAMRSPKWKHAIVVRDDDDRAIGLHRHFSQQFHNALAVFGIERRRRFVANQQPRFMRKRPGDRRRAAAGRRKVLPAVHTAIGEPNFFQPFFRHRHGARRCMPPMMSGTATFSAAVSAGSRLYC